MGRSLAVGLLLALAGGCGDDGGGTEGTTTTTTGEASSSGEGSAGALYGACDEICSLDFDACIKPGDGAALEFCTKSCAGAEECAAAEGGTATPICVDAGAGSVCALDCGGAECPAGGTCKLVATVEGTKSLCFVDA